MKRIWDPDDIKPSQLWDDGDDDWNLGTSLKHSEINLTPDPRLPRVRAGSMYA